MSLNYKSIANNHRTMFLSIVGFLGMFWSEVAYSSHTWNPNVIQIFIAHWLLRVWQPSKLLLALKYCFSLVTESCFSLSIMAAGADLWFIWVGWACGVFWVDMVKYHINHHIHHQPVKKPYTTLNCSIGVGHSNTRTTPIFNPCQSSSWKSVWATLHVFS
jgi:hypothetical protein